MMTPPVGSPKFHPIVPGAALPGDWYGGTIPRNITTGADCVVDSAFSFKQFFATGPAGLRLGNGVTLWRTSIAVEADGVIEIGDHCYLANASLVCCERIMLGSRVMVAGGVTIADADFHPVSVVARIADTIALSPIGDRSRRPSIESNPVIIEDDVWIGYNATILKGVTIGAGALVEPGAVVLRDVPAGGTVSGNPAILVSADRQ